MDCRECRDALGPLVDGELSPEEAREVHRHVAVCAECAREYETLKETHRILSENLMRYAAPDVLKARIRGAVAEAAAPRPVVRSAPVWWRQIAAGVLIAAASSALTFAAVGRSAGERAVADELLSSHLRSLMPGHLTDVVSTNQHTVKPWFNGRVDVSPPVPNLDSLGFPLVGGRTDYVRGRAVPVVVYGRRQHLINVYAWPSESGASSPPQLSTRNGYHFLEWRAAGLEYWAVSDLNTKELQDFVSLFSAR
jgi:anti-sigma factor RsiW